MAWWGWLFAAMACASAVFAAARAHWALRARFEALSASEARFRAVAEASPLGLALFDAKSKEMVWSNERYSKLSGLGLDRALGGMAWLEMALSDTSPVVSFSRDFKNANGTVASASIHTARLSGDSGEPMLLALVEDSTKARQTRDALEASKMKFELLFKLSPAPIAIMERKSGLILEVNDAFTSLFGGVSPEWRGKTLSTSGVVPDGFEAAKIWAKMVQDRGLSSCEAQMMSKSGQELICTLSATEMDWGESSCFALCSQDVTDMRLIEEEVKALNMELEERARQRGEQLAAAREDLARQERLASLGALVAGIAHELNTPVGNGLTVATTLVSRTKQIGKLAESKAMRREDLAQYLNEALDCSRLIERNMLAASDLVSSFKQVSVDQSSAKRRSFDMSQCVRDTCLTLAPSLKKAKANLTMSLAADLPMDSFPGAVSQCVINLVNNALMHGLDGKPGNIEVGCKAHSFGWVDVWVQDDGAGISKEDEERIFDPFFSTKFGQGGSGLGLSIVYSMARDIFGGSIRLEPSEKGAKFVLRIPMKAP